MSPKNEAVESNISITVSGNVSPQRDTDTSPNDPQHITVPLQPNETEQTTDTNQQETTEKGLSRLVIKGIFPICSPEYYLSFTMIIV